MNDLKIWDSPEWGMVRAVEIGGEPWMVGKDVATALGYERPVKAVQDHVDPEDRNEIPIRDSIGRMQKTPFINESGLYSLVLGSKLPSAKRFRRWVTSVVLPSIRKDGVYQSVKNRQRVEQLESTNAQINAAIARVSDARQGLAEARKKHDFWAAQRDASKGLLAEARALHAKNCDTERQTAQTERDWAAYLDAQIGELQLIAAGLPVLDEVLESVLADAARKE